MYIKDYYSILGVMPSAEDIVIRAAYKALAQRYHPDKFQGVAEEAKRLMQEINEAYSVLSDPEQKRQYDEWYAEQHRKDEYQTEDDDELSDALKAYDKDWKLACDIYPELNDQYARLNLIANRLAMTYKILLLESKQFANSKKLAMDMEDDFFRTYFGANPILLDFAKKVVLGGHKKAAKALNEYVRVLGADLDARRIIEKICGEFEVQHETNHSFEIEHSKKRQHIYSAATQSGFKYTPEKHRCPKCGFYSIIFHKERFLKGPIYVCPDCGHDFES